MSHYRRHMLLAATPGAVYDALTTPQGLRGWWTPTCDVESSVGGQAVFRFDVTRKAMRIERLLPGREVAWRCVEANIDASGVEHKDEWVGTQMVFALSPQHGGTHTQLDFEHIGLTPALDCFEVCNSGWNHFLDSLQAWVETGKGQPFVPGVSAGTVSADKPLIHFTGEIS